TIGDNRFDLFWQRLSASHEDSGGSHGITVQHNFTYLFFNDQIINPSKQIKTIMTTESIISSFAFSMTSGVWQQYMIAAIIIIFRILSHILFLFPKTMY